MNTTRLLSMIRKEFIQILRDRRTLGITVMMPVMLLLLLGYSATSDVRNVPLAVIDRDRSAGSRQLIEAYRTADYFHIAFDIDGEAELRRLIDNGSARAGLIIPPGYGDQVAAGHTATVAFILDGSDPAIAGTAFSSAELIAQARSTSLMVEKAAALGQSGQAAAPIEVRTQVWYNPDLISAYYMIPALIGLILQFLTGNLTAMAIVRERERGTIEQLGVTPLSSLELMIGKLVPFVVIGMIDTMGVLALGVLIFGVPINGSIALLLLLSVLFLASTLGLGLFISTITRTQQEAQMASMFVQLPSMYLSGFFFPLAAMPKVLQWLSYAVPLRYFLVITRGIVLKGVGAGALWPEIEALAIFAVVIMGAAALRFRTTLD
jgi:ABC-2 type transport system permease protein